MKLQAAQVKHTQTNVESVFFFIKCDDKDAKKGRFQDKTIISNFFYKIVDRSNLPICVQKFGVFIEIGDFFFLNFHRMFVCVLTTSADSSNLQAQTATGKTVPLPFIVTTACLGEVEALRELPPPNLNPNLKLQKNKIK